MPFFKKKPVVIEAQQLTPTNWDEIAEWVERGGADVKVRWTQRAVPELDIKTLEGTMTAAQGWWVIKGVKGEFYPCAPDIFDATYNPVTAAG